MNFIDDIDKELFLEYLNDPSAVLLEMANFVGDSIVVDKVPFSFFISDKSVARGKHAIRAKIIWNSSKAPHDADGYLMLHGDYEYVSGSHKYKPTTKELQIARNFFKKYKVLFAAVWEQVLDAEPLQDYMKGYITFSKLVAKLDIEPDNPESLKYYYASRCKSAEELEAIVREHNLFNMND